MPEYPGECVIGQFLVGQLESKDPFQIIADIYDPDDLEAGAHLQLHLECGGSIAVITRRI